MGAQIHRVEYFYCNVKDRPGEAYRMLSELAAGKVNLYAFTAVPVGPDSVQLTIFPKDVEALARLANRGGITLDGPQKALLVHGDDELGALVEVHRKLADARINVYASTGVTDGKGGYGYLIFVKPEEFRDAARALGV